MMGVSSLSVLNYGDLHILKGQNTFVTQVMEITVTVHPGIVFFRIIIS